MNRSTFLTFAVFCLFNQLVHADVNSASAALSRGDYAAASQEFLRLANDGDARAQANLGYMYYVGEGVPQDYARAVLWYRKAAVQGDKDAQYNLAVAYAFGEGTKQDYREAAIWYRRAAEQGHAVAQYSLGISYSYGEGVKQNSAEAVKWFQKSAEQGYARAQVQLASKYHTGDGVALDYQKAVKWYRQAADRGDAGAQYNLGSLYRSGKGVTQDYNQAVRWYRMSADQGYAAATNELASLERAIAGANRSRSKPDLQPAPVAKSGKVKEERPTEEAPLLTVEKSDLLTLDSEEEQVDEMSMQEMEAAPETVDDTYAEAEVAEPMEPEQKKPGRISGFFKKLFKKKEVQPETTMAEEAEPENIEDLQAAAETDASSSYASTEAVAVEDLSDKVPDTVDEVSTEREVVTNEPVKKKSRFGFFKKLFGKKDKPDTATVEDHTGTEVVALDESMTASDETDSSEVETVMQEEVADVNSESSVEMDTSEVEVKPKKQGFFKRLFGKKEIDESSVEESQAMTTDTIAMVEDAGDNNLPLAEDVSIDSSAEENAAMDALEVEQKPKKKGFFRRLFSKSDDEAEEINKPAEESTTIETMEPAYVADAAELEVAQVELADRNYESAFNSFYELARSGDATAQYQLGLLYYQGLGVEQNYDEASDWYRRAGEQGNADAQYSLGNMFLMGEGVAQDDSKAISWYEKAASQGHVAARHNADNLRRVAATKSVTADEIESELENEQAADSLADTEATNAVEDKPKKGFFRRLFGKKDQPEETNEEETSVDVAQGPLPEIQPAAETATAVIEVEQVKAKKPGFFGRLFGKKAEANEAASVVAEAAPEPAEEQSVELATLTGEEPDQSFEEALTAVKEYEKGLAYSFGDGVPQDDKAAFEAFLRSAKLGHAPAQYKTGVAYAYAEGVDKDPEQAVHWYQKAAEKGYMLAQRNLGVMYMNGDGVEQNKPLALAWYSILADTGNVMDVHRRDALQQQLSEAELEEARAIKASLKH